MTFITRNYRRIAAGALGAAAALSFGGVAQAAPVAPTGTVIAEDAPGAIEDSYIVVFRDTAGEAQRVPDAAEEISKEYGGSVRRAYGKTVKGFNAKLDKDDARRLAADPAVAYVEQDRVATVAAAQSNAPWGLDRIDQRSLPLSQSYRYSGSTAKVTAYILDTGIRTSHRDFGGRARNGYDFIDNDRVAQDCNGHGTHVAGTVGGKKYGVAKQAKLVGVRVLNCQGAGSYSQIIAGVDWVTKNAKKPAVANMSLGGTTSKALDDAVRRSIKAGVTYVVAAGNSNANACRTSPARTGAAITVGATDNRDRRASFSNYGSCVDIFAPGVRIASAGHKGNHAAATMNGTSMAAPHVAGAAAGVLAAKPWATPAQVERELLGAATRGTVTGAKAGSPNRLLYAAA